MTSKHQLVENKPIQKKIQMKKRTRLLNFAFFWTVQMNFIEQHDWNFTKTKKKIRKCCVEFLSFFLEGMALQKTHKKTLSELVATNPLNDCAGGRFQVKVVSLLC
jgi:hypothetical protein